MAHFICNRKQFVRLYQHPVAERLTHGVFWLPAAFYLPIVAGLTILTGFKLDWQAAGLAFGFGLIGVWPLFEYSLHRFGFHFRPRNATQKLLQFRLHGVHHDYPRDQHRLVIPLPFSFLIAMSVSALCLAAMLLLAGGWLAPALIAGFLLGYLGYDYVHWMTHRKAPANRLLAWLRSYHLIHHYAEPEAAYGVTSPVWDWVFGTLPRTPIRSFERKAR